MSADDERRLDAAIRAIAAAPTDLAVAQAVTEHAVTLAGADRSWLLEIRDGRTDIVTDFGVQGVPSPAFSDVIGAVDPALVAEATPTEIHFPTGLSGSATLFPITHPQLALGLMLVGHRGQSSRELVCLLCEMASASLERIAAEQMLRRQSEHIRDLGAQLLALGTAAVERAEAPEPRASAEFPPATDELTDREREILEIITTGASNAEIARRLIVSVETVKTHVKHILRKLNAANRSELIARFGTTQAADQRPV